VKSIDVCLSPELMHLYDVREKTVVVVDILRATSCMVTAFAHGAKSISPVADLEGCRGMKVKGFITSGERNGEKVNGFDKGNSPFEYMTPDIKGKKIAFTTTNGTQAIEKSKLAKELLVGAFLNLSKVTDHLKKTQNPILILCAGWKGRVNLEDTLFAGAVIERLQGNITLEDDSVLASLYLYQKAKSNLVEFLNESSHVKRLNRLNIHKDIEFCLTPDQYDVLPVLIGGQLQESAVGSQQ
jgi:2-phosphosulfolactate phosphatase